eukprot:gene29012-35556_t
MFPGQSKEEGFVAPSTLQTLKTAIEIARGMDHLVKAKFVHRDLAARNVLIDSQFISKIADFGLSRGIGATDPDDENAKEPSFEDLVSILMQQLQAAKAAEPGYDFPAGH